MTQIVKASTQLATTLGIEPQMMIETIKAQCFPNMRPDQISDAQLAAFVSVANGLNLNPLVPGMLYAYPQRNGGITPVTGPDGVFKKLSEMKGVTYECEVFPEDPSQKPTHAKASIYVEGKERPYTFTAYFGEWKVENNPNWNTRPRHMIWLRALKQCARQVIHGLPMDEDEVTLAGLKNVTPETVEEAAARPAAPERPKRGVAAAKSATPDTTAQNQPDVQTPAKPEPSAQPAQAAAIDVVAEPVTEKKSEQPTLTPEKKAEPAKQAEAPAPISSLKDGQRVTFEGLTVTTFAKLQINNTPSVKAEVKGSYTGVIYHIGGAENTAWQTAKPVNVTLLGKKLTSGPVITVVEKAEVSSGSESLDLS